MPEFVLRKLPTPRQVLWEAGRRIHLTDVLGEDGRTLCGLRGLLRPVVGSGVACLKCRAVSASRARLARIMKSG